MKTTVVPAQITTVEDKIAGNLSLSQLLLFAMPVFGGAALYAILPPFMASANYKFGIIAAIGFFCSLMAIRIKGTILVTWLIILGKYNLRPRFHVFDKSSMYLRTDPPAKRVKISKEKVKEIERLIATGDDLTTSDRVLLEQILLNPGAAVSFETTKRGGLRVLITEVE